MTWESFDSDPSEAVFSVYVIAPFSENAMVLLWEFVSPVAEAVEAQTSAVVRTAEPALFRAGTQELPCYILDVQFPLGRG